MSVARRVSAFLQLAEEELAAARLLETAGPRQAAYFCQQSAEKLARAILAKAGVPFGTGHGLARMAESLPESHPWRPKLESLDKHSPAATRYRYPTQTGRLFDPPDVDRLRADIAELERLLDDARGELG